MCSFKNKQLDLAVYFIEINLIIMRLNFCIKKCRHQLFTHTKNNLFDYFFITLINIYIYIHTHIMGGGLLKRINLFYYPHLISPLEQIEWSRNFWNGKNKQGKLPLYVHFFLFLFWTTFHIFRIFLVFYITKFQALWNLIFFQKVAKFNKFELAES